MMMMMGKEFSHTYSKMFSVHVTVSSSVLPSHHYLNVRMDRAASFFLCEG